ncbi:MAG: NADH-quinone oxidoreductase subunit C [Elusimicrobia bacterium]|nr:NADH-quinone oxidoreductase subunit C [Candidatus Liberimonas magnetica]
MDYKAVLNKIVQEYKTSFLKIELCRQDEAYLTVTIQDFNKVCLALHKELRSCVMTFFAVDKTKESGSFHLYCAFQGISSQTWFFVVTNIPSNKLEYNSLSKEIYSASLFEREIKEMFGLIPLGNPDQRMLHLHDEVWPAGNFPLRKEFDKNNLKPGNTGIYPFAKTDGEGIFEVPVGPVHAGIIGPGHFRFSAAGEPIINLEIRLGFTHRGVEKLFENSRPEDCLKLAECISGDSVFAHTLAFCHAVEKIGGYAVPVKAQYLRCLFLELERMYNHVNTIGGIALDVGFSFPSAHASVIKESILSLNDKFTQSRYLKGVNVIGGVSKDIPKDSLGPLLQSIEAVSKDFNELKEMLLSSSSFMDRVDTAGILDKKTAEDIGIIGLAARASGLKNDLRKDFPGVYQYLEFKQAKQTRGDVLSRLNVRIEEFEESIKIIGQCAAALRQGELFTKQAAAKKSGYALGYCEGSRGPVLYWLMLGESGLIERCKITDPSFHNWQGLSYAAPGNIIPDFPLCNKSFDLSYPGNDL